METSASRRHGLEKNEAKEAAIELKALNAKIGELTMEGMIFWKARSPEAGLLSGVKNSRKSGRRALGRLC